ncbi:hypothetical protein LQ938_02915 [Microbacterium sp. cx-55]|uniref:hypothetical protein n=1 Tax=Microbacterium sp. cx-55 TaxID=2875948 RepID=UPI001CC0BBF3|nr:hypothetical protein [Microbacterium sp. cx-55]MBZ4486840.1 hypothetical protein [Microbacterium sp. cx-55]UGB35769.1 hypothetical protein LQ938_02915 [Microbacterium sp. cx-55]
MDAPLVDAMSTRQRRKMRAIRTAFAVCILILPVELVIARLFGEPYPALFQPAFVGSPESDRYASVEVPHVSIRSGTLTQEIPYLDVIPESDQLGTSILRSMFGNPSRATNPETVDWLRAVLRERYPDFPEVQFVDIEWRLGRYAVVGGELESEETVREVTIDLRSP